MLLVAVLLSFLVGVFSQYPLQRAPPHRPSSEYNEEYDYDDYQQRIRPQPPPPPRVAENSVRLRPASVHYVNIGAELAGDYKFGYDTGKGDDGQSFREETRLPDGSVHGAYGYVDETGRQRIVKYVAGKEGFRILKDPEGSEVASRSQPKAAPSPRRAAAPTPAYIPPPQQDIAQSAPAYAPSPPQARYNNEYEETYAPQPAYRIPAQPAHRPESIPQRSYVRESRPNPRYRNSARHNDYEPRPSRRNNPEAEPDYDYPVDEMPQRRLVPVDTTLFNYNIGTHRE